MGKMFLFWKVNPAKVSTIGNKLMINKVSSKKGYCINATHSIPECLELIYCCLKPSIKRCFIQCSITMLRGLKSYCGIVQHSRESRLRTNKLHHLDPYVQLLWDLSSLSSFAQTQSEENAILPFPYLSTHTQFDHLLGEIFKNNLFQAFSYSQDYSNIPNKSKKLILLSALINVHTHT